MHPILAHPGRLGAYLAIWVPLGALLAALLAAQGAFGWTAAALVAIPLSVCYGFLCLSAWYVTGGSPVERLGALRVAVTAIVSSFLSSAVWLLLVRGWLTVIATTGLAGAPADMTPAFRSAAPIFFGFGFLLYLLAMAVSYLAAAFEVSRDAERRGLELQVLAREAELRALRAQIDPHFLFNSLHSISALTTSDPASARRMCVLLADFLRESLALGVENRITLKRELGLAARFLDVERVRYGSRLQHRIDAEPEVGNCLVPPLLLQPLVENAITHGIAHTIEGGTVLVTARRQGGRLTVVVENPCDPDRPRTGGSGVGVVNVRSRLAALHGTDARLETSEADGTWRVELVLPVEQPAAPAGETTAAVAVS